MHEEKIIYVGKDELKKLISDKLHKAGLSREHADITADHLVYADSRGVHSHGAMRVEYYAERISKGGINADPKFTYTQTGPCTGVFDGDNGSGFVVAREGMFRAIDLAKQNGIGVVTMKRMSHCGTLSYYIRMAAAEGLIGISMCQSDPMVVPYGGTSAFFGTNPIGFAAPREDGTPVVFDMATTVGAWGKILDARSKGKEIPDTWAVDEHGHPTTDPFAVHGLLPIAGAKGYGLMMMVDILSGILSGAPYGPHVTSMYSDLSEGRELGQIHIVINPDYFVGAKEFYKQLDALVAELHKVRPAKRNEDGVSYPGERSDHKAQLSEERGIPIVENIYNYLVSDAIHFDRYECGDPFAHTREPGKAQ